MSVVNGLHCLLQWVEERTWISRIEIDDLAALLEARDEDSFSSRWMQAEDSIASETARAEYEELVTKLRESVYLQAFDRWKSPDLSACLSDDFGLIANAIVVDSANPWISGLLQCYLKGRVPVGDLEEQAGKLVDLLP
ncbi:hypothetical protein [Lignipirellula cremea]|uniref:Uncharacterized protein n=1 Tax=Lignipirellula cremea TaxID=2528010 RepID=A0A518DXP3_9BACT|nr:hypothetical protein [Lignipirellula cremea]QDU96619.1 hypothetical protein Pla8534_44400 [Lignipirellula cremea]